jgi:hypothetical protein
MYKAKRIQRRYHGEFSGNVNEKWRNNAGASHPAITLPMYITWSNAFSLPV